MFLYASKSGAVIVADSNTFITFDMEGFGQTFDAVVISATIEPKPVIQTHGSVGGEVHLNIFGEDAMMIRVQGMAVGDGCKTATSATTAVAKTVDYFREHSVLGRAQPLTYQLGDKKRKKGYLVAGTIRLDGAMRDVVNFDFVILSEPITEVSAVGGVPSLPASPGSTSSTEVSASSTSDASASLSAVRNFASANPQLLASNGDLVAQRTITVRTFGAPSQLAEETA